MNRPRIAVIGCGHLGKIHARLLAQSNRAELVAVVDPVAAARHDLAEQCQCQAFENHLDLVDKIDAAIVAAPTTLHAQLGVPLLDHGVHLLVEKPLAANGVEARQLVNAAERANVVLGTGHVERFNPAFRAARSRIEQPRYIEAERSGPFSFRSTDIGVVMDLMIHDLDLVLHLVDAPIVSLDATGQRMLSEHEDQAEARIVFADGTVASLRASRVTPAAVRTMRIYEPGQHTTIDFAGRNVEQIGQSPQVRRPGWQVDSVSATQAHGYRDRVFQTLLPIRYLPVAQCNPLEQEQADFLRSVQTGRTPAVSAVEALRAVETAELIVARIHSSVALSRRQAA